MGWYVCLPSEERENEDRKKEHESHERESDPSKYENIPIFRAGDSTRITYRNHARISMQYLEEM